MKPLSEIVRAQDQQALAEWVAEHAMPDGDGLYVPPPPPTRDDRIAAALSAMNVPPLYHAVQPSAEPPKRGRLYTGKPGIGKTYRAIADGLALELSGKRTRFLSLPAYMTAIRTHEPVPSLADLRRLDALVLDDIAQAAPPEWMRESLYSLIDGLLNYRVLVITTSNCGRVEIAKVYRDPIASRLKGLCKDTIALTGPDRRLFEEEDE